MVQPLVDTRCGGSHTIAGKRWLPPRGLRAALLRGPPAMAAAGFLVPWARPPPPCAPHSGLAPRPGAVGLGAWLRRASGCSAPAGAGMRGYGLRLGSLRWKGLSMRMMSSPMRWMQSQANQGIPLRGRILQERRWRFAKLWKRRARNEATHEDFTRFLEVSSTVRPRTLGRRCRKRIRQGPPGPLGCPGDAHGHDEGTAGDL